MPPPFIGLPQQQALLERFAFGNPVQAQGFMLIDTVSGDTLVWGIRRGSAPSDGGYSASKSAGFNGNNIIGRSSPVYGYRGSDSTSYSISFEMVASMDQGDNGTPQDIKDACDWLLSLAYPDYQGIAKPPHPVIFRTGNVNQRVLVTSVTVNYKPPYENALAMRASVSLSMAEVEDDPKSVQDLRVASGEIRL